MKTMKGILFAIFLGGISLVSQASMLTISPRYTNAYRFAAADAWNLDLQFTGPSNLRVYFTANISTAGKQVATLRSGEITITPGAQSISATTIATAQLQYLNQGIADVEALTGTFPAGNYKVCYNAYCITPDCDGLGADAVYNETPECFELIVEPPTPLLLSMPEDKAELEYQRPTFNWIPPIPVSNVSGFNYLYTLVEKNKGQSCQDAIVRNRPVYKQSGIEQIVQPYPPEINDLDTGKSYCWKVDGLVGDIPVAQSEVWEFKVKGVKKEKYGIVAIKPEYALGLSGYKLKFLDTIKIVFDQEYQFSPNSNWKITLQGEGKSDRKDISTLVLNSKYLGLSQLVLVPSEIAGLLPNQYYIITIQSEKNELSYARIKFLDK